VDRIGRNKEFIRGLYAGMASRPAWIWHPPGPAMTGDRDYSLGLRPMEELLPDRVRFYREQVEWAERLDCDLVPIAHLITGTQLMAQAFGCDVHLDDATLPCARPLVFDAAGALRVKKPRVEDCACLMRVFEMARLLQRELGTDAPLAPCDMQTGFDTACLVWDKNDIFIAMLEEPEAVEALAESCAALLREFLVLFRREFPTLSPCHCPTAWAPPELGPWVSNDECGAFGVEMFERFCLPELVALSETFGGVGMHCCADAEHQFPSFRKIPNFYAFNRVEARRGYLPVVEHWGAAGRSGPVFSQAWMAPEKVGELLRHSAPGMRWSFTYSAGSLEDAKAGMDEVRSKTPAACWPG